MGTIKETTQAFSYTTCTSKEYFLMVTNVGMWESPVATDPQH